MFISQTVSNSLWSCFLFILFEPVIDLKKSNTHHLVPSWEDSAHQSGNLFVFYFLLCITSIHYLFKSCTQELVLVWSKRSAVHHRMVIQRLTPIHTSRRHQFILTCNALDCGKELLYKQNPNRNRKNMQTPNGEASTRIKPFSSEVNSANFSASKLNTIKQNHKPWFDLTVLISGKNCCMTVFLKALCPSMHYS